MHEYVGTAQEPGDLVRGQHRRPLADVVVPELKTALVVRLVVHERADVARGRTIDRFDLDDVRAEPGEQPTAVLRRLIDELDHTHAFERTHVSTPSSASACTS